MKKPVLAILSALFSVGVTFGQDIEAGFPDLIVIDRDNSLRCTILGVEEGLYRFMYEDENGGVRTGELAAEYIMEVKQGYFRREVRREQRQEVVDRSDGSPFLVAGRTGGLRLSVEGGYSHCVGDVPFLAYGMADGYENFSSGYTVGANLHYVLRDGINSVGVVADYRKYAISQLSGSIKADILYIAPSWMFLIPTSQGMQWTIDVSVGYAHYRERWSEGLDYNKDVAGLKAAVGWYFPVGRSLMGLKLSLFDAPLPTGYYDVEGEQVRCSTGSVNLTLSYVIGK